MEFPGIEWNPTEVKSPKNDFERWIFTIEVEPNR